MINRVKFFLLLFFNPFYNSIGIFGCVALPFTSLCPRVSPIGLEGGAGQFTVTKSRTTLDVIFLFNLQQQAKCFLGQAVKLCVGVMS